VQYRAELVSLEERDGVVERVARFDARRLRRLTGLVWLPDSAVWTERTFWRRAEHAASFVIEPELTAWLRGRVHCTVEYRLTARDAAATVRTIEGTVTVDLPAVGAVIERAVVTLLELHFAAEAGFLARFAGRAAPAPSELHP
jgi:Protein of unknown function (DUF2505)